MFPFLFFYNLAITISKSFTIFFQSFDTSLRRVIVFPTGICC